MSTNPPPYPPPPAGPPYGPDWKYQRRILKDQARAQRDAMRIQRDIYRTQVRGMRRGSIIGPICLVAIGIVFLLVQTGHLASYRLWDWYGRWWPLLLVGLGVVLLIEWIIDQKVQRDSQQPYIRRGTGGGVVTIVLVLIFAGLFSSAVRHNHDFFVHGLSINPDNIDEFLGDKHESDQTFDQDFPANTALSVTNPRGDVTVSGTSTDNQIHISAHKQVFSRSDSDAATKAQQLVPQITNSGGNFSITMPTSEGAHADLVITIPPHSPATVNANHGDVRVTDIQGPVTVTANHGDIDLSTITGPVNIHINNGGSSFSAQSITGPLMLEGHARDLTISDVHGPVSTTGGPIRFHTSRTDFQLARLDGDIDISPNSDLSANAAQGPVTLNTRNRNITLDQIAGDLSVTNRNGSVDLTSAPPIGNINVENRNGSVTMTLPEQASFTVQAQTNNGDVDNDFSLPDSGDDNHKTLTGTVGKGGSLIRITTSEGDISLKKASIHPLPPVPPRAPLPPGAPAVSINGSDGSSVYVGKDGVRIIDSSDGSSVIVGKDGLRINASSDGSSVYHAPDGTSLTENADGSKSYANPSGTTLRENADGSLIYHAASGTRYIKNADGSQSYQGNDGTRITLNADGSQTSVGPDGKNLSDSQARDRLHRAEDDVRKTEQNIKNVEHQRDEKRRKEEANKGK